MTNAGSTSNGVHVAAATRYLWTVSLLPLTLLFCALPGTAQTGATGSIQGSILDSSGAAVPAALVTARNEGTQSARRTQTGTDGRFSFAGLPIGRYTLDIENTGFSPAKAGPFLLSVGQIATQDITLQPAGVTEKINVSDRLEAVDLAATSSSVALGYDRIEEAPAPSRNYLNFVLLAPNVAPSSGSNAQTSTTAIRNPLADSGFTFGGLRGRNNSITIDGVDNRDETTGGNRVAVGLEMVQEFRVAGVSVGAEMGGAAGGLVNVVTRSGANLWHGDATFFVQNEVFNARKPENASPTRPRYRRYQPGTSLNGPLRKDRTFVSGAIEYERESSQEWSEAPLDALPAINRALRTPIFSKAAVRQVTRGLYDAGVRGLDASAKINHQLSENDSLSLRYAFSRGRLRSDVQGPENFADVSAQGSSRTSDHSLVGNWLHVLSPRAVSDFRVQFAQRGQDMRPNSQGALLEIPGLVSMGQSYRLNADRTERHFEAAENLSFVIGPHRLSAGIDLHAVTLDATLRNRYDGIYIFPTLGDFVAGRPDVFIQAFGNPRTSYWTFPIGLWLQDRWELRPGLQFEAGLRYERQRLPDGLPSSSNNWSPRLGIAWRPVKTNPLVVRAGFGLFYDRYPLAFLNDALQKDGQQGFEQYAVGADAARAFALAEGGTLPAPLSGVPASVYRASAAFPSPYSRKFSVGIEQGFGKDTSLTIEASDVRGFHLPRTRNILGTLPPLYQLEETARSAYRGASVSLNRRLNKELAFLLAYTIGRAKDDGSDFDEQPLNPLNIRQDWARSRQDQLHRVSLSALFELPVEELKSAPEWFRETFEGISFAPIFTYGSGRPLNALATTDVFRTGAYPISARPFGLSRNPYFTPSTSSFDMRVMKTVPILNERAKLQLGIEGFNLLNHANVLRVSPYFSAGEQRLNTYRGTIESLPGRQLQFLMHVEF